MYKQTGVVDIEDFTIFGLNYEVSLRGTENKLVLNLSILLNLLLQTRSKVVSFMVRKMSGFSNFKRPKKWIQ